MNPTFTPKKMLNVRLPLFLCSLVLFFCLGLNQQVKAQTGCSIIKTGCPPLISPLCATKDSNGVLGAYVSWTPPSFALSCPGEGGSGYAFNMEFDLNESLSAAGCWEYNKVQRVGTSGGKLRLWQSTGTGNPWVKTPGFYLTGTTNLQLTIYAVENFTVNVYLINTTTLVETLAATTPTLNIVGNSTLTNYPFTITPPAPGAYKFRFEFVGGSSNANEVQVLSINATVLGGCTGDVNFVTTSNVNPGSFFAAGCTNVTYTATCNSCTSPGPLTETCTFQVCVNGIKAEVTGTTPTTCGLSNGTVTFDTTVSAVSANANALQYSLDGGTWTTITSPLTLTGLSGGAHTLNVRAYFDNISGYCTILAPINFNITTSVDALPPTITCPTPAASYTATAGLCTSSQSFTATATDLCDPSPVVTYFIGLTPISFPYNFPVGSTTVKAVATDAIGNSSECTFNVVVVDNQAPTLTGVLPTGGTALNFCFNAVPAGPTADAIKALYTDNCGGTITVTKTGTPTGNNCSWSVTYTYEVKDQYNNTVSPSPTVTYSGGDKTAPTGTAPTGTSNINACYVNATTPPTGTPAFNPTTAAAGYSDNCGGTVTATLTNTAVTGNSCSWTVTYTFKVADACGNELTGRTITHTGGDKTAPTGTAPTGTSNINACFVNATTPPTGTPAFNPTTAAAGYTDNCGGVVTATLTNTAVTGNSCSWTATYTFKVADACGNELTGQTIVYTGGDKTAPTGTAPSGSGNINACFVNGTTPPTGTPAFNPTTAAAGFTDNCGGVVTATLTNTAVTGNSCSWTVTYTFKVADACGNELTGRTIVYTGGDKTAPTGTAPTGTSNINACFVNATTPPAGTPAFNPTTAAAGYTDNCGGVVTATLTNTAVTGNSCSWTATYTFKVADACGNELTGQTIVYTGGDKTAPTGTAPAGTTNINACFVSTSVVPTGTPAFSAAAAAAGYTDNCGGAVTATLTNTTISGNNAAWSVVYTFKVADACGNELLGQTITHTGKNQNKPTITACAASSSASAGANCTAPVPNFAVTTTATSPCGILAVLTKTQSPTAGTAVGIGVHTITITVTDEAGNFATCTTTFTVSDNTAPNLTCPANITMQDDGCGTAIVEITPPNATDNCSAVTLTGVRSDALPLTAPYPIGVTTITWTATDATNHTTTCTQTITITKSTGTILANYTFLGFTAYPFNANETAPGISSNVNSPEPFENTGSGTPTGPLAFKTNAGTNEALVLQPSSGNNTRYIQFVVSGASLKFYSLFQVYLQAERQPQGATLITLTYSTDNVTYTNVGNFPITDHGTWYEKVFNLSSVAALNNFDLTQLYFRLYVSGSNANGSSDATRLEIDNFQVFASGVGPTITCPPDMTVDGTSADCFTTVNPGTATGQGRCGTPNISSTRSDGKPLSDPFPQGVTTITWKATDENGAFATCVQTITVNCVPLPAIGLQLKGNRNGMDVHLLWSTLTEQNTSHFIMERSFDGVRFEALNTRVPAAGNSNAHRNYNLVDKNVPGAVVYYRVKMYDNNGQMKMSNLVAVTMGVSKQLRVYPNPVHNFVTIEFGENGNYQVDLIADNGQLVLLQKDVQVTNSFRTLTMPRNNLISGQYQMRIWNKTTGKVDVFKMVYLPRE